jgi:hypothetical protein
MSAVNQQIAPCWANVRTFEQDTLGPVTFLMAYVRPLSFFTVCGRIFFIPPDPILLNNDGGDIDLVRTGATFRDVIEFIIIGIGFASRRILINLCRSSSCLSRDDNFRSSRFNVCLLSFVSIYIININ